MVCCTLSVGQLCSTIKVMCVAGSGSSIGTLPEQLILYQYSVCPFCNKVILHLSHPNHPDRFADSLTSQQPPTETVALRLVGGGAAASFLGLSSDPLRSSRGTSAAISAAAYQQPYQQLYISSHISSRISAAISAAVYQQPNQQP